jgi:hypothetical protein
MISGKSVCLSCASLFNAPLTDVYDVKILRLLELGSLLELASDASDLLLT